MPTLACWTCGRRIYTTEPRELLLPNERRCPRCGALMHDERRHHDRRQGLRRENPSWNPGPPGGLERRQGDRRSGTDRRRRG